MHCCDVQRSYVCAQIVDSILTKESAGNLMGSQHSMDRLLVSKKLVVPISRYSTYAYNNGTCNLYNSSNALTRSAEVTRLAVRTLDALAMKKQPLVSIFQEARDDETIIESLGERLDSDEPLERDDGTHKNDITERPLVHIANP